MSDPIKGALDLLHAHPEAAPIVEAITSCHSCGADVPHGAGVCKFCRADYEADADAERERLGLKVRGPKWDPYD